MSNRSTEASDVFLTEPAHDFPEFLVQSAGTAIVSALLGFLGAVSVFRSRFDIADTKREELEKRLEERRQHDKEIVETSFKELNRKLDESCSRSDEYYARIERRQKVTLELIADLARKGGVTHRALGADVLARALGGELDEEMRDNAAANRRGGTL